MRSSILFFAILFSYSVYPQSQPGVESIEKKVASSDFQGVLKDAEAMIASSKTKIEEYTKMINGYAMNRDPKKKPFDYKHELAIPFYYRGIGNAGLNKADDALADFSTAIKFDPKFGEAYTKRAEVHLKKGNTNEACKDFKRGMNNQSKQAKSAYDENFCWDKGIAYYKDGKTELNLKRYDQALELFNESLSLYADSSVYALRSKAFVGLNNIDSALIDITRALEMSPENTGYFYSRGMIYYNAGDYQAAFDDLSKCINGNPGHAAAYMYRALSSEALSQQKSAIYDYNQVIRLEPENGQAYYKRGLLKETVLNDRNGACEDYRKAIELGVEEAEGSANHCKKVKKR